jgi:hypothetical protein
LAVPDIHFPLSSAIDTPVPLFPKQGLGAFCSLYSMDADRRQILNHRGLTLGNDIPAESALYRPIGHSPAPAEQLFDIEDFIHYSIPEF